MDEVFDLKNRNQWLRRRIVAILQQIAKTMFGDSINRLVTFLFWKLPFFLTFAVLFIFYVVQYFLMIVKYFLIPCVYEKFF